MHKHAILFLVLGFAGFAGCRGAEVETPTAGPVPPAATEEVRPDFVPAGTTVVAELNDRLGTDVSRVGQEFTMTVLRPVRTDEGETVIPEGATILGEVTGLDPSDRVGDQAAIRLNFREIAIRGQSYPFQAVITNTEVETERGDTFRRGAIGAGVGAAAGAALGAILGRSLRGALIGGALGAGAGTVVSLGTGDVEAVLPAGTDMALRTTEPIRLEEEVFGRR